MRILSTITPRMDAAELGYRTNGPKGAIEFTAADIRRADHPRDMTKPGVSCSLLYCTFGDADDSQHHSRGSDRRRATLEDANGGKRKVDGDATLMGEAIHYSSRDEALTMNKLIDIKTFQPLTSARLPAEGLDRCYTFKGPRWDRTYASTVSNGRVREATRF